MACCRAKFTFSVQLCYIHEFNIHICTMFLFANYCSDMFKILNCWPYSGSFPNCTAYAKHMWLFCWNKLLYYSLKLLFDVLKVVVCNWCLLGICTFNIVLSPCNNSMYIICNTKLLQDNQIEEYGMGVAYCKLWREWKSVQTFDRKTWRIDPFEYPGVDANVILRRILKNLKGRI